MAAWREERLTGRKQNQRSAERIAPDSHPTCPRCLELLEPGARYCAECGCAVTIGPVYSSVEGGDKVSATRHGVKIEARIRRGVCEWRVIDCVCGWQSPLCLNAERAHNLYEAHRKRTRLVSA